MAQNKMPPDSTNSNAADQPDDDESLRKRLLSRIAVAGVVIVGLLGSLAVFDSLNKPQVPALPKMATAPAEPEPKASEAKPAESPSPDEPKPAEAASVPERTDTPLAPTPADKPSKTAKAPTPPATARPAAVKPPPPAVAPIKPEAKREIARVMPETTAPAHSSARAESPAPVHAPASRPLTQAAEGVRRFLVQVGVFSNYANAEELVAKLQQAGITAHIESRVQIGPFASRAEADLARSKLKSLGIDDGMLVRR